MSHNPQRLTDFLDLSTTLTGFSEFDLRGTGQAQAYLDTVLAAVGPATTDELLAAHGAIQEAADDDQDAHDRLLRARILGDDRLGPVARNLMKLWYLGTWYAMSPQWTQAFGVAGVDGTFVVSRAAYTEGLVWPAIGANPPGAKGPGYGTWAEPPAIALT